MDKPESICLFGDSTAWGAWDREKGGWANRLWLHLSQQEDYCELYNLSISGGTTDTLLSRFEAEAKIRQADALIFQCGGNDAALAGKGGPNMVPIEKYEANLGEIIARAKKLTDKIVFVGFKNVDEARTTPVSWHDVYYWNAELTRYGKAMENICAKHGLPHLKVFGLMEPADLEDGVHPNARGHEKIFEKVRGFLAEQGWIGK